ncbi:MAG: metal-dependent hydrolase [Gemmataceae bacterium]
MATSYTHAIVGAGLVQLYRPGRHRVVYWSIAALLAVIPDIDALSSASYGAMLGHRGYTHSIVFALWIAFFAATLTYRLLQANLWKLTGAYFLAAASHGLLDALTYGGMPIPFFWPATNDRFGNWGPIPVADISWEIPSPWRSRALRSEMIWVWIPTVVFVIVLAVFRSCRRCSGNRHAA